MGLSCSHCRGRTDLRSVAPKPKSLASKIQSSHFAMDLSSLSSLAPLRSSNAVNVCEASFHPGSETTIVSRNGRRRLYDGKVIFAAKCEDDVFVCCDSQFLGFDLTYYEDNVVPGVFLRRPSSSTSPKRMDVSTWESGKQRVLGCVYKRLSLFTTHFTVQNPLGDSIYHIQGPVCTSNRCNYNYVTFKIRGESKWISSMFFREESDVIGKIVRSKHIDWDPRSKDAPIVYEVVFPPKCSLEEKVLLLGAVFLINSCTYKRRV